MQRVITMSVCKILLNGWKRRVISFEVLLFLREKQKCISLILELNVYLLINNIDGINFRNTSIQNLFKLAAQCQYIHILATIDHINGPLSRTLSLLFSYLHVRCIQFGINKVLPVFDGYGTLFIRGKVEQDLLANKYRLTTQVTLH